jgi:cobalt-zinc-cadmium efflux system protein
MMHHHSHCQHIVRYNRAFKVGIALNLGFVLTQAGFGFATNSLALLADAVHNLSDVIGLLIAWGATLLSRSRASKRHTYGLRRASIFSPLINSSLLLGVSICIALEAIERFADPKVVEGKTVMFVAFIGILINSFTAWMFHADREKDINIKGAFLHMVSDAVVSGGVVLSGLAISMTGWQWFDPIVSLLIGVFIAVSSWRILQESLNLALDGVPNDVDLRAIQEYLIELPGVGSIHDLHVWALSSTEPALTVHLVMLAGLPKADFLSRVSHDLREQFGIEHSTIQIEVGMSMLPCMQSKCGLE